MTSPTAQFVTSRRLGLYEPIHQISMWADFKGNEFPNASVSMFDEVLTELNNQSEDNSRGTLGLPSKKFDQEAAKPAEKVLRRLAQNREAARKSRLRKKAYVQELETSRAKLIQLQEELERIRQQGLYIGGGLDTSHLGYSAKSGIMAFEMEYEQWLEGQDKQVCDLKTAMNSHLVDMELRILVDDAMQHYFHLFDMKANAAKADVLYIMSGMWKTSAERFFLWIGGFRPSEVLKVLWPQLDQLTEQQKFEIHNLRQSCQQLEDALTHGLDKLQQTVSEAASAGQLGDGGYIPQVMTAVENLEALASFVAQADHLRKETLQQMSRTLDTRQAARGLVALGEYCQRLRALSMLWAARLHEPA
ncbi:transcription factor TGA1-like isoform X1 [Diospyros lotus]|uniref:transcription factor TGA1-like isoform X1 n=1 Tax=Diospyros lotus TaxID=55363 RepID=UPI002251441F|nr:transcription factor TGA1-like isoform X1 [Diospyros lotus]XP_052198012.1 transcription factor TGA1-like isoform X1 [Diospyros lotus]XP_052198013.1 transcription factor TGA1-like isoform X1 [Diospyros lotus]XP_052198014.1 transcription factor TGA1-like isoform X1 [Diospyros lotus]XP_052198015.1 transcription factor TGA1-like isoform X1 [Diospyros lotus]